MAVVRVLVVDDSAVARKLMARALESEQVEVVGSAPNGRVALEKIERLRPDLVTLDLEMPVMSGLELLDELRERRCEVAVIVVSALTTQGAGATIEALSRGAQDYVTKPSGSASVDDAVRELSEKLLPKVHGLIPEIESDLQARGQVKEEVCEGEVALETSPVVPDPLLEGGSVDIVAIGTSTGGPNALDAVIPALPGDLAVPVVIVQHMPPVFTTQLARRLDRHAKLTVTEGEAGMLVEPGVVYIAPGGLHMVVSRTGCEVRIETNELPAENSCRPAVDPLFRSVADVYGASTLGVIMTGMGSDGLKGCEELRRVGARILVQDEATSVVWGMPGFVARAGLASAELPLDQMAAAIANAVRVGN